MPWGYIDVVKMNSMRGSHSSSMASWCDAVLFNLGPMNACKAAKALQRGKFHNDVRNIPQLSRRHCRFAHCVSTAFPQFDSVSCLLVGYQECIALTLGVRYRRSDWNCHTSFDSCLCHWYQQRRQGAPRLGERCNSILGFSTSGRISTMMSARTTRRHVFLLVVEIALLASSSLTLAFYGPLIRRTKQDASSRGTLSGNKNFCGSRTDCGSLQSSSKDGDQEMQSLLNSLKSRQAELEDAKATQGQQIRFANVESRVAVVLDDWVRPTPIGAPLAAVPCGRLLFRYSMFPYILHIGRYKMTNSPWRFGLKATSFIGI